MAEKSCHEYLTHFISSLKMQETVIFFLLIRQKGGFRAQALLDTLPKLLSECYHPALQFIRSLIQQK